MSSEETLIHVRLLAGERSGIRIAALSHEDFQAILIPSSRLHNAKEYTEGRLAVYLLLEKTVPRVYIGQTDDAFERLNSHNGRTVWPDEPQWDTMIVLRSKTEGGLSYGTSNGWNCVESRA